MPHCPDRLPTRRWWVSSAIASVDHPVFYYRDPDHPNRLIAYDWDGMRRVAIDVTRGARHPLMGGVSLRSMYRAAKGAGPAAALIKAHSRF
jgi:hypothetical protein